VNHVDFDDGESDSLSCLLESVCVSLLERMPSLQEPAAASKVILSAIGLWRRSSCSYLHPNRSGRPPG